MDPEYEKRLLRQQNGQVSPYNSVSMNILNTLLMKNYPVFKFCCSCVKGDDHAKEIYCMCIF